MKQEENQLLLVDLCGRLPYGVIVRGIFINYNKDKDKILYEECDKQLNYQDLNRYESLKPYLRPLSSMTEEEKKELKTLFDAEEVTSDSICYLEGGTLVEYLSRISYSFCSEIIDWLNAHHFDYHNLIEKGLALEASSEMYKKGE